MKASALRTVELAQRCLLRVFLRILRPKSKPKEATATPQQGMLAMTRADNLNCVWNMTSGEEYIPCADSRGISADANVSKATDMQTEGGLSSTSSLLLLTEGDTRLQDANVASDGGDSVSKKSRLTEWMKKFEEQRNMKLEDRNANSKAEAVAELAPRKLVLATWLEDFETERQNLRPKAMKATPTTVTPNWEEWARDAEDHDDLLLAARYRIQDHIQQKKTDDSTIRRLKAEITVHRKENEVHRKLADEYFKAEAMLEEVKRLELEAERRELLMTKRYEATKRELLIMKECCEHLTALQKETKERLTKSNRNNLDAYVEKKRRQAAEQSLEAMKKRCLVIETQRNAALHKCRDLRTKLQMPSSIVTRKRSLPCNDPSRKKKIRSEQAEDVDASVHTQRVSQRGVTESMPLPLIELHAIQPCKRPGSTLPVLMTFR